MKKALLCIFTVLSLCLFIGSCGSSTDVPEGMKLASDTSRVYYSLYVPEEWIIDSSTESITAAHASKFDRTSINVQAQEGTSIDIWWSNYKSSISFTFTDVEILSENEDMAIGGLNGKSFVFTVNYGDNSNLKYELIAVLKDDLIYNLTFAYVGTKEDDKITYTDAANAESIKKIKDNFHFNDSLTESSEPVYEAKDMPENMKCASNAKIVDYYLFVPNSWIIEETNGTISSAYVSKNDKTNVNVMQWNVSSYDYEAWWNDEYKKQLFNAFDPRAIVIDENNAITYSSSSVITIKETAVDCKLGENDGKKYTYSVKIGDNVYDYQVFALMARASVYVMTFTFKSGCDMSIYQEDIDKILNNFRFS